MDTRNAYNRWAASYDAVENKTRDLEAEALRSVLASRHFDVTLEIGCGTGKNTNHLAGISGLVKAVDFSEEMLAKAKNKVTHPNVEFVHADITKPWPFQKASVDLVAFSLVLEHIEPLRAVFHQAALALKPGGLLYVCELHPFKQYSGSKARFENNGETLELECFVHHVSDYFSDAAQQGFDCIDLQEWFDDNDRSGVLRLISFLFRRA